MTNVHAHVEPFGFDRIFHNADPGRAGSAPSAADMEALLARLDSMEGEQRAALARARSDAFQAGLDQARRQTDVALLAAVDAVHAGLDDLDARFAAVRAHHARAAADVALAAAEALAGHAIDRAPLRAVSEALDRALDQIARGTPLSVRIHPDQHEALAALLTERQRQDRRQLQLIALPDATVPPGDAVIAWDEGGLAIDAAARRAAVLAELEPALRGDPA
ncbi:FliH/SctL family protein [Sphingomonas sp. RIT328]|uniref:FliH/SctL family protein n=1 Tax=Sphingomonas sp. RIT328 TaxID=1470591 RepID=UPI00044FE13D|nr:FliH/SctL family protein [Sphingomonas sp. RIT328]EZP48662.1 FlbE protein [Sphingomonas sp. RIT328]